MNESPTYLSASSPADLTRPFSVVVDDEKRIADTIVLILAAKGYAAEAAYDGASALSICRERVPDLVLSDVVMPVMNGMELAIALRNELPACKILLLSGQAATAEMMEQADRRGYKFDTLSKPIHPDDLLVRVRELIGPCNTGQTDPRFAS